MTGERRSSASLVIARPVAVSMIFLAATVFGLLSLFRLPVTLMPELSYPTLTVRTEYPGAAPEEVENDVSRPLEEELGVIAGLGKISSISRAGASDVVLEFAWDADMSDATQDVLERLDLVFLPEEAERPLILHFDPSLDPVLELSLSGTGAAFEGEAGLRRLRRLAEQQIKKELEPIKGVAAVRVRGGLEEEIHVLLEEEALRRTNLSIERVIERLRQDNVNVAGGTLKEGRTEYLVRTLNEYQSLDQIEQTVVARIDGRDVRVGDIGRVELAHREREIVTRTDGGESVQIEVFKEGDANIVALAKLVRAELGSFDPSVEAEPAKDATGLAARLMRDEGARLQLSVDRSLFIESSVRELWDSALIGGLLAVLVLYLFLRNVRSTLIVAAGIPVSLLLSFAPLYLLGVSLNIMSLGGLALGVGMLVDSSIVVLESIYRCREEGDGVVDAADRGTCEVRGAVWASTLTAIAVFFPMVFVEGIAGQAFGDLGLAVVVSNIAAVVVALYLIPMLASRKWQIRDAVWNRSLAVPLPASSLHTFRASLSTGVAYVGRGSLAGRIGRSLALVVPLVWCTARFLIGSLFEIVGKLVNALVVGLSWSAVRIVGPALGFVLGTILWLPSRLSDAAMGFVTRAYPRILKSSLTQPVVVVTIVVACFWLTWQIGSGLESELLPEVHQGEFAVEVTLPVGTPLEETESIIAPIERAILEEKESIRSLVLTVGYDPTDSSRSDEGEHTARFKILLAEDSHGPEAEQAVVERLRARFAEVPDLGARIIRPILFSFRTPIEVEIHGHDLRELREQAARVRDELAALPQLADVEATLRRGAPEVQIVYDRDLLARYDLDVRNVATLVRDKVAGYEATRFNRRDRRVPVMVRLEGEDRETVQNVRETIVNPGGDRPIPLAAVASVTLGEGPSEVRRIDSRRVAVVRANIAEGSLGSAIAAIENRLRIVDWPGETSYLVTGQNEEWERSERSLWIALALSVFLVYVIMAAQFESLLHPLVIMFTIPLAFVGTVVALALVGFALSIVVLLGMILLAGIVVNNAIVLLDYVNTLRRRGIERDRAIVLAGSVRLRPILMTTATTVLGLLPMAFGIGDGAEIRTPMAIAVIGGMVSSTALTLLVIPGIYRMAETAKARLVGGEVAAVGPVTEPAGAAAPAEG